MIYLIRGPLTCVCEHEEAAQKAEARGFGRCSEDAWREGRRAAERAALAAMRQAEERIVTIPASVEVLPPAQWVAPWRLYPVDGKGRG